MIGRALECVKARHNVTIQRLASLTVCNLRIVLASSSKYRRDLLRRLGLPFETDSPEVDETPLPGESPRDLVLRLAEAKAATVAARRDPCLVIASDQVAVDGDRIHGDRILGKPGTEEAAVAALASLSGREVTFLTSLVVVNTASGTKHRHIDETRVQFRELADEEIRRYVAVERPLDCAGAFKSEGRGALLLQRISCEDPAALIGLPLIRLGAMLRAEGVDLFG